ncbi:TIGR04222 domain-containing membrane protein [Streptomyces sp. URMC 124]|uniref:TIGR04222 domain-containing membrane protein n=1 Tax=Streptomyces sp. URMC 124 TaxID=3423405 RepID=UPI003F1D5F40
MPFGYFILIPGYALAVLGAAYGLLMQARARRARRAPAPGPELPPVTTETWWGRQPAAGGAPRDVLEIAWLQGGAARTADTALLTMQQDGLLHIDRQGHLFLAPGARPRTPVERAITTECAEAGRSGAPVALRDLRKRLIGHQETVAIGASLTERGLAYGPED